MVLSPTPTTASKAYMDENPLYAEHKVGDRVELSPDTWYTGQSLADLMSRGGGTGLVIDYGQDYAQGDTIRVRNE